MTSSALDAMGSDLAPDVPVAGAVEALRDLAPSCEIVLVGQPDAIEEAFRMHQPPRDPLRMVEASEVIAMSHKPLATIRVALALRGGGPVAGEEGPGCPRKRRPEEGAPRARPL